MGARVYDNGENGNDDEIQDVSGDYGADECSCTDTSVEKACVYIVLSKEGYNL